MKKMKTPFGEMLAAVPADIQREVDLEFAISNRIDLDYEHYTIRNTICE